MALLFDRHLVGTDRRSFDDRHLLTDVTSFDKHFAIGWINYQVQRLSLDTRTVIAQSAVG